MPKGLPKPDNVKQIMGRSAERNNFVAKRAQKGPWNLKKRQETIQERKRGKDNGNGTEHLSIGGTNLSEYESKGSTKLRGGREAPTA